MVLSLCALYAGWIGRGALPWVLAALFVIASVVITLAGNGIRRAAIPLLVVSVIGFWWIQLAFISQAQQPCLGFPVERVTYVEGRALTDSSLSQRGNRVTDLYLRRVGTAGGDWATASGKIMIVTGAGPMIAAGSDLFCYGTMAASDDNTMLFLATGIPDQSHPDGKPVSGAWRHSILLRVTDRLSSIGGDGAVLCTLLLLGRSDEQGSPIRNMAMESGSAHILALSGMHLHCLAMIAGFLLGVVLGRRRGKLAALPLVALYVVLIGFRPSLVRSLLMLAGTTVCRNLRAGQTLALACVMQTVFFPHTVLTLGSVLSYAALGGILLFAEPLAGILETCIPRYSATVLSATISAMACTAPLSLSIFGRWYPIGLVTAAVLAPTALVLLVCSLLWLVFPTPGIRCAIDLEAKVFVSVVEWGSGWSAEHAQWCSSEWFITAVLVLLTGVGLLHYAGQTARKRNIRRYDMGFSLRFPERDLRSS